MSLFDIMLHIDKLDKEFNFTLKNDYAFKRLLGVEENKAILQDFLECMLDLESDGVAGFVLLGKELKKDHREDRTGILDIQVRLKDDTLIDIEIQGTWNKFFPDRSLSYLARMYASKLKARESYSKKHKCISINIIGEGFNLNDAIHSRATFREDQTYKEITDGMEMHFLNLEKVRGVSITEGKTREIN